ncbi:WG repeat-containing protein [Flavobacterium sp. IB48]|uniref:WG repeat-containing protein n=1 Tax=Flavobacterium sp. IB48 TaxID=2779375 RepID=UPI0018E7DE9C|nr:WG repeat-containing protein [Flavobacterium sp. IB48]MBJ2123180.1 WG repeat-containing protein [Flavobacterium sp. IB48]
MKQERIIFVFLLMLMISCSKIDNNVPKQYVRIMGKGSWGYNDEKGNVIIPLGKYKFLNPIDEKGMILAELKNKHGYIDIHENVIVPFDYDDISLFSQNLACVKKGNKYGFVDRNGKIVIPIQFEDETYFQKTGLALVEKNKLYGFINKQGKEIIPIIYQNANEGTADSLVSLNKKGEWAFFDSFGKQKSDFIYDEIALTNISVGGESESTFWKNGLILVRKNKQIAYLDKNLKEVVSFGKYNTGERFNKNRIAIVSKNHKYGIIDEFGKERVKPEYDTIEHPEESYHESEIFVAKKGNYLVLLDKNGKKIYDKIKDFSFDHASLGNKIQKIYHIQDLNGKYGAINTTGELVIPIMYDEFRDFRSNNNAIVKYKGKFGLVDLNNKITYPIDNEEIEQNSRDLAYYIIKKNGKVGIINKELKTIINFDYQDLQPCFYDQINKFIAKQNGLYGVIDRLGGIIIPFQYTQMSNWVEYGPGSNFHFVTKDKKQGLITKEGKTVIPVIYDSLFYDSDKIIILSKNGQYGVVTIQNKQVIPFMYEKIYLEPSFFSKKKETEFYVLKNGKYSIINDKNEVIKSDLSKNEVENKFSYYYN